VPVQANGNAPEEDPGPGERLTGVVDFHIHTSPDVFPRTVSAIEAAEAAKRADMGAIVVKSHSTDSAARAETARNLTGFPVYGGVVLNVFVGGLNPYAVVESVRQGGRIVWMPTITARHFVRRAHHAPMLQSGIPAGFEGLTVTDERGRLKSEAERILEIVAEHGLVLCSGHISPEETVVLFQRAHEMGIQRLIATHPNAPFVGIPTDIQRDLAGFGAYLEWTPQGTVAERVEAIRAVGAFNSFISTDAGSLAALRPVPLMTGYIEALRAEGFTEAELHSMTVAVPSFLLGLEGFSRPASPAGEAAPVAAGEAQT
jgi:Family of unknown function (DUF6282)